MKLAEALIERSDLQKRIAQLKHRMGQNVKIQEGEEAAESIDSLLTEYNAANKLLMKLVKRINKTNASASFMDEKLIDAIVTRDCLSAKIKAYRELYDAAITRQHRYSRTEIKYVSCVDLSWLQKEIDSFAKDYRILDTKLQETNWNTELLD